MTRRLRLAALFAFSLVFAACDSSGPGPADADALLLVGNQGNFSDENGSITLYDLEGGTAQQRAVGLGDALVQQVVVGDGVAFALLNFADSFSAGTGRLDVVDLATRTVAGSVPVNSPRGMATVGTTGYVTSLYGNAVVPVDLTTYAAGAPIGVGANPEGVVAVGDRVYVANYGFGFSTTVSVLDASTNEVTETLDVGCDGPRSLAVDAQDEVWVFCTGKTVFNDDFTVILEQTNGQAVVLDGATGDAVARIELDAQLGAASLGQDATVSARHGEAYALVGPTLLRFDTAANALAGTITPDLAVGTQLGAVHYDDRADRLFLGTFTAFDVAGAVVVLDRAGAEVDRFTAGVAPAAIASATVEG